MNLADLKKPFAPDRISWRVGSTTKDKSKGMALAYIDARDVQDRLDEVCGVDGWQCRYIPMHDKKTVCEIGIFTTRALGGEWIWKADGAGDSDVEAEKGALSDAFKRAAVKWGIGRYLYDLESPWVELDTYEKNGQVFAKGIKAGEFAKLRALLAGNKPAPAPVPTPTPAADTPAEKAKAWAASAERAIGNLKSREDMARWSATNAVSLDKLRGVSKPLYDAINLKIAQRNNFIEEMAAA